MIGDNGASKEGTFEGVIEQIGPAAFGRKAIDRNKFKKLKIEKSVHRRFINTNYPLGWAQATNTPLNTGSRMPMQKVVRIIR